MPERDAPQPPYVLLFREAVPGAEPLVVAVEERPAVPLFDSAERAQAFLESADFGGGWRPAEVSGAGLIAVLDGLRGRVPYVALNPPPARSEGGMRVEVGGLEELVEALQQSRGEDDLFGLLGEDSSG